jgi:uncharacterized iron-regulated membrane protein
MRVFGLFALLMWSFATVSAQSLSGVWGSTAQEQVKDHSLSHN